MNPALRPSMRSSSRPVPSVAHPVLRLLVAPLLAVVLTVAATGATLVGTAASASAHSSYIVLVRGDHGTKVSMLQRYLGMSPSRGNFGKRTEAAVRLWQARHHRHVTGMVGRFLWSAVVASDRGPVVSRGGDRVTSLNWAALARCESGGNPRAVNPAGYYGLYQFSVPTWHSVGGSGLPSSASSSEQTSRAQALYRRSGDGPWPTCGHHLYD